MRQVLDTLPRLAEVDSPVLLTGESGTGKDLVARWLHDHGPRRAGPFVKIHCPSIPEALLESELFGHERGAFTDARQAKPGRLEGARDGTVYLDQVEALTPALQAKLLRVVEEGRFERLGGTRTVALSARILSSATQDLRHALQTGSFREDLYHRLAVVPLALPPLRERREDILPLAELFLARERGRGITDASAFEAAAQEALGGYPWPGNVRELRAAVERAALYAGGATVLLAALPPQLLECPETLWAGKSQQPTLKDVERAYVRWVLERSGGSQTRAAHTLGISRKALWEKRRRYGIP
jgi:DNA-binding NtrC family response regulator